MLARRFGEAELEHQPYNAHQDAQDAHQVRTECPHYAQNIAVKLTWWLCWQFQSVPESEDADHSELPSTDDFGSDGAHPRDPQHHHQHQPSSAHPAGNGVSTVPAHSERIGTIYRAAPIHLPFLLGQFSLDG